MIRSARKRRIDGDALATKIAFLESNPAGDRPQRSTLTLAADRLGPVRDIISAAIVEGTPV
ncbi:hypothetical protein [Nocardia alba]|uniref:hypothetical protein n=1 Tax=Nocardia alba TaxID=225051 RepID=UPI003C7786C4